MLQGMERGKVLDFWVWAVFFQKLLMSPSLHGAITPLYFHCLLSVKSLLSLLSAFGCLLCVVAVGSQKLLFDWRTSYQLNGCCN